jgi:hypothetical protein
VTRRVGLTAVLASAALVAGATQLASVASAVEAGGTPPMLISQSGPIAVGTTLIWGPSTPPSGGRTDDNTETWRCQLGVDPTAKLDEDTEHEAYPGCEPAGGENGVGTEGDGEYTIQTFDEGLDLVRMAQWSFDTFPSHCCFYLPSAEIYVPVAEAVKKTEPETKKTEPETKVETKTGTKTEPPATPNTTTTTTTTPTTPPPVNTKAPTPPLNQVNLGNTTLTPTQLSPGSSQNPSLVIDCAAGCTTVIAGKLQLGTVPAPWTPNAGAISSARVTTTALKTQRLKFPAGEHTVVIKLSAAQHKTIEKALAAHKQARVVLVISVSGQPHKAQLSYVFHR